MYWTLELASYLEDAPWPATKDELIDYSIRSFEVLEREMSHAEKNEVFQVFGTVGRQMGVKGIPDTFEGWQKMRQVQLSQNMQLSNYTHDLFAQYRKHLGALRFRILLEAQMVVVPQQVRELLRFRKVSLLYLLIAIYKVCRFVKVDWLLKDLILPEKYKKEIKGLDGDNTQAPKSREI